jgi:hypothetical protein
MCNKVISNFSKCLSQINFILLLTLPETSSGLAATRVRMEAATKMVAMAVLKEKRSNGNQH